jgi:sialidase-1
MHAAEALTVAGFGDEVRPVLTRRLANETDDQRRCGLARELARSGSLRHGQVLLDILASENPHGHVHACESLFKIGQIGDGRLLRAALRQADNPRKSLMAAAALARWGSPEALRHLRTFVGQEDGERARLAAWALARTGDRSDGPSLRDGVQRFSDPVTRAYFQHALAALGDDAGREALVRNLASPDPAIRIAACEFAVDARPLAEQVRFAALLDDEVLDVRVRAAQALLQLALPVPLPRDQMLVRDVYPASQQNPRYSEGSVCVLSDGRLLYATTEFVGSGSDFAAARIVAAESLDQGQTWGAPRVLQENIGQKNVMSATLRRLSSSQAFDSPLGLFYLVKNSFQDLQVFLRISTDDGSRFSEPIAVTNVPGYHVLNNDRITVLSTGRIVVPVASTEDVQKVNHFVASCFLSDDGGRTWKRSQSLVDYSRRGAMEPEVIERADGTLLMHLRTQEGHIAISESSNGGDTWTKAKPWDRRAPEAPATLRVIPSTGDWLLIWNDTFTPGAGHGGKRTPLTAAVSTDGGRNWPFRRDLETDPDFTYAYTSVVFHQGRALLTYYVADEKTGWISSRFRSVPISWFYQSP